MSTYWQMAVEVHGAKPEQVRKIHAALRDAWFGYSGDVSYRTDETQAEVFISGCGHLCVGVRDKDFARQMAELVWEANKGYCQVFVRTTCLENLPTDQFRLTPRDYERWKNKDNKKGN